MLCMKNAILHVVGGLPGSGKTTFSRQLEQASAAVRFCPDEWMVALDVIIIDEVFRDHLEQKMTETARMIVRQGGQVIIEFGSWARAERDALRQMARQEAATVCLYWLDAPVAELARRIQARGGPDTAALTAAYLQLTADRIERPTDAEGRLFDRFERIGSP